MKNDQRKIVYWTLFHFKDWELLVGATETGLCYVGSENKSFAELEAWREKRFPGSQLLESAERLLPYTQALQAYFSGEKTDFTMQLDYAGTEFQQAVWAALLQIPYGRTATYTQIAEAIDRPKAVRAVGAAIGANPLLIIIPCHRVIAKDGSLAGYRGGLNMKTRLLQLEQKSK